MVDRDGGHHGLASSWDTWAEECCLTFAEPRGHLRRIYKPLACSLLSALYDVGLLCGVVCGRDPFQNPAVLRGVLILPNEVGIVFDGLGEFALGCKQHRSDVLVEKLTSGPSATRSLRATSNALFDPICQQSPLF
jgi:hypothetical protein